MNARFKGRDEAQCELCGAAHVPASPGGRLGLAVHHVSYDPEETVWLCQGCHSSLHNGKLPSVEELLLAPLQLSNARRVRSRHLSHIARRLAMETGT